MSRTFARLLLVAVLTVSASVALVGEFGTPAGAQGRSPVTVVAETGAATRVSAYGGVVAWSFYSSKSRSFRLMVRRGGRTSRASVRRSQEPFDVDLGPGRDGRPRAVYSRCRRPTTDLRPLPVRGVFRSAGCDIFVYDFDRRSERRVGSVSTRSGSEQFPTIWRDRIGFVRAGSQPGLALYVNDGHGRSRRIPGGTRGVRRLPPEVLTLDLRGSRLAFLWRFNAKGDACGEGGAGTDLTTTELWLNGRGVRRLATDCTSGTPTFRDAAVLDGRFAYNNFSARAAPGGFYAFVAGVRRTDVRSGQVTTAVLPVPERDPSVASIAQDGPLTFFATAGPKAMLYRARLTFR